MRTTYLEVNLEAISHNIKEIQNKVGKDVTVMPVIKADGYGTGAIHFKEILEKNAISIVGVAIAEEGILLRKAGFNCEIVILNQIPDNEIEAVVEYDLIPGITLLQTAEKLNEEAEKRGKIVSIHLEIDTGMGRNGVNQEEVEKLLEKIKTLKQIKVDGMYTHFSSADSDPAYTKSQIEKFNQAVETAKRLGINPRYLHTSASSGIAHFPEAYYNLVRPGLALLGYYPDKKAEEKLNLKPSTKLFSSITYVKEVPEGTSISYGRKYITQKEQTKIATVQMGYADGYRRQLSNKGYVLVQGKLAPVVGRVCMDSFMIDVSKIPEVKVGDTVTIWDNETIKLQEVADWCETIDYEILCGISKRVPRKYSKTEGE